MLLKALRWAIGARRGPVVFFVALLLFIAGGLGAVGLTSAIFTAGFATKTATFGGGYVAVPTISAVYPSTSVSTIGGYDGVLVWTNGTDETTTNNEIQQILGADRGSTSNCTGASYSTTVASSITSPTTTTTFTYTDSNRATTPSSSVNGDWYCYEVVHGWPNTTAPTWTAAATTNVRIGLAPISVKITAGSGCSPANRCQANRMDGTATTGKGDVITITYNQPVTMTSGSGTSAICSYQTEGVVYLGDTGCTGTPATQSYTLGKLTIPVTSNGEHHKTTATIQATSNNQITLQMTAVGPSITNGSPPFVSSTNGGTVVSTANTDRATACTTGSNCTVNATGSF